ncbi:MAG: chloride channel protein, partial [Saprospiraceae bacterium]|nr:chloride channel protein [Saprospiraceae bacterium]
KIFSYSERLSFYIYTQNKWSIFILTPVCFVLSWWLVRRYAPLARGSGIPQVMAALELSKPGTNILINRLLGLRIIVVKVLASALKVIGGGILGREGPTLQISSSLFNEVGKRLPKWWIPVSQKNMLIAGAASGLAAAFNTPLGGIIFAIEELSKYHIKYYKSPLFIAVIIAGLTAQGFGGSYLYLGYPKLSIDGLVVIVGFLLVAIVAGYFGAKMCTVLLRVMNFFKNKKKRKEQLAIVIVCALFVATFNFLIGTEAMGSGKEIMERTLFTSDKTVPWYLPFVRMNGLIASFSFGGAGGIFAPSLSSGACFGALIAQVMHLSGGNADLLILIGMTSFLTGVTRAPFTSAIIIFEMTDRHSIIFFLLMGSIIANAISSYVDKRSLYDYLKDNYLHEVDTYAQINADKTSPKKTI